MDKKIYCKKCGYKVLDSDAEYCPRCGSKLFGSQEIQEKQKDKRIRNILFIGLAITIIACALIIGSSFFMNQDKNSPLLTNAKFTIGDFDTLGFSADLNPTRDYDYLSIEIEYYDNNNNLIDKTPIAWNQNNVKANQPVKINQPTVMSYYQKPLPTKAIVKVYDSVYSNEPIQTLEVAIAGNNTVNNTTSQSSNSDQKTVLAYKSDGTPMYTQAEVDQYMQGKYGDVNYHIGANGYIDMDEPGYDDAGHRVATPSSSRPSSQSSGQGASSSSGGGSSSSDGSVVTTSG